MADELLPHDAVTTWRAGRDGWEIVAESRLRRRIECGTFRDAIGLVDAVADEAERADHHPDIDIRWRTVTFVLSTHSAGGITAKDLALAERIDALAAAG